MKKIIYAIIIGIITFLGSCQNNPATKIVTKTKIESTMFLGSWVQPNPINDKEVQGFILQNDGSAKSINMETLKHIKWWLEYNRLVLIEESIGNRNTSIDTIKYEVVKINEKELELKSGANIDKYRKQ